MKKVSQTSLTPTIFHQSHKIFWPTLDLLPIMKRQDISQSMLFLFKKFFKLKYSWFAMIQVYSKVIQLYTHTHTHTHMYVYIYIYMFEYDQGLLLLLPASFPAAQAASEPLRLDTPVQPLAFSQKERSPPPTPPAEPHSVPRALYWQVGGLGPMRGMKEAPRSKWQCGQLSW